MSSDEGDPTDSGDAGMEPMLQRLLACGPNDEDDEEECTVLVSKPDSVLMRGTSGDFLAVVALLPTGRVLYTPSVSHFDFQYES